MLNPPNPLLRFRCFGFGRPEQIGARSLTGQRSSSTARSEKCEAFAGLGPDGRRCCLFGSPLYHTKYMVLLFRDRSCQGNHRPCTSRSWSLDLLFSLRDEETCSKRDCRSMESFRDAMVKKNKTGRGDLFSRKSSSDLSTERLRQQYWIERPGWFIM